MLVDLHEWDLPEVGEWEGEFLLFDPPAGRTGIAQIDQIVCVLLWLFDCLFRLRLFCLWRGVQVQLAFRLLVFLVSLVVVGLLRTRTAATEETETTASLLLLGLAVLLYWLGIFHLHFA
jgi:hypothetical protein